MASDTGSQWDEQDKTAISFHSAAALAPAQANHAHFIAIVEGAAQGRFIELGNDPFLIGRQESCNLCLNDGSVSKRHCMVQIESNQVYVTDLNSTNGSFLNGLRIGGKTPWPEGGSLRLGTHVLKHEYRDRKEYAASEHLAEDLRRASTYVQSLLPPPIAEGPVRVEWCYVPSAVLGGDCFGYHWLDQDRFVFYLVDVCGHGVGPALHSVSILNLLRQHSLVGADFGQPADVLARLNAAMQMDEHGDMFFSIWYGVYSQSERRLSFSSGGHPPSILLDPQGRPVGDLNTTNLFLGMLPGRKYVQESLRIEPGSRLCVLSDGAFEITTQAGAEWTFPEFREVVAQCAAAGQLQADALYRRITSLARNHTLDDDFSLMILDFT